MNRRLTKQRRQILEIVQSACYHPTAEQVYLLAKKTIPGISVGTVYRNLDLLTADGRLRKIDIPGEPARYDADLKPKAYFVSRPNGVIYDIPLSSDFLKKALGKQSAIGRIDDFSLVVFGIAKESVTERGIRKGRVSQFLNCKTVNF
jgi:Fe2+ or Zn2+ uptake regulation protein